MGQEENQRQINGQRRPLGAGADSEYQSELLEDQRMWKLYILWVKADRLWVWQSQLTEYEYKLKTSETVSDGKDKPLTLPEAERLPPSWSILAMDGRMTETGQSQMLWLRGDGGGGGDIDFYQSTNPGADQYVRPSLMVYCAKLCSISSKVINLLVDTKNWKLYLNHIASSYSVNWSVCAYWSVLLNWTKVVHWSNCP